MPLSAAELAQCRKAFLVFDRNCDGMIDKQELKASLVTLGHPEPRDADMALVIAELDTDRSGGIEWPEFLMVMERQKVQQLQRGSEADSVEAFVAMGGQPDRSGHVSVERMARTLAEFELRVDLHALLEALDVDDDGEVTYEEFKVLLTGELPADERPQPAQAAHDMERASSSALMDRAASSCLPMDRALAAALAGCPLARTPEGH